MILNILVDIVIIFTFIFTVLFLWEKNNWRKYQWKITYWSILFGPKICSQIICGFYLPFIILLGFGDYMGMTMCWVAQSCPTLCHPMDCSPPGSSGHGILQATIPSWIAVSSSRVFSWPGDQTHISCLLHCRWIIYPLSHLGSPGLTMENSKMRKLGLGVCYYILVFFVLIPP